MRQLLALALACLAASAGSTAPQGQTPRRQVEALLDQGRLDDAERVARGGGNDLAATLGEVLVARGRLVAAESAFSRSIAVNARDHRSAQVGLAELAYRRGNRDSAFKRADALAAAYERDNTGWSSDDREAAGRAYLLLGTNPKWARSALVAFDDAVAKDSSNIRAMLRVGDLFFDKYNAPDARAMYETVLRRVPGHATALFGIGRVLDFQDSADAMAVVQRAVAANPSLVPALVTIANAHLEAEAYDSASVYARRALAVDSSSSTGWAVLGAVAWIAGDSARFHAALASAQRLNARPAEFYEELADAAVRNRRYADVVTLARQALALDPSSVRALGTLGTDQLRLGDIAGGRATMERAFALDPFNPWYKNTLDLLDHLATFRTVDRGHFRLVVPPNEADVLTAYLFPLLEEAYDSLATRYDYRPVDPIRIEIYDRHADFSVRTVGLAGLGALGVSFGTTLAMDSPTARERGTFSWGSTAWHELTHTFTLGKSDNRVPRWLSEGLSVFEQRRARPEWGAAPSVEFLAAYKARLVRKPSELNEGFVQGRFPGELQASYYDASLVCEMIYGQHGSAALVSLLNAYRDGLDTPAAFQRVLGVSMDTFDKQFDGWVRTRFELPLRYIDANDGRSPITGEFADALKNGAALVGRDEFDSAQTFLTKAMKMFPDYSGAHSPPWYLASIELRRGNARAAVDYLTQITGHNEDAYDANELEARLREQLGDRAGAERAFERMVWIWPWDQAVHASLADLAEQAGQFPAAIRERRVILAMNPSDRLEARYQLASVIAASGDTVAARREILSMLEEAPGFEKAQALLLKLTRRPPPENE